MRVRLDIFRGYPFDEDDPDDINDEKLWEELGTYPDLCRAEIMQAAHSSARRGRAHYRFVKLFEYPA